MTYPRDVMDVMTRRALRRMADGATLWRETAVEQRVWLSGHKRLPQPVFAELRNRGLIEPAADTRADSIGYQRWRLSALGRQTAAKEPAP